MSDVGMLFEEVIPINNIRGRNDRYTYAKVRRGDTWYFLKRGREPSLRVNLQREQLWAEFMRWVAASNPGANLRSPTFIEYIDEDTILLEYCTAEHLSDGANLQVWRDCLPHYAQMLCDLDSAACLWTPTFTVGESRSDDIDSVWKNWLGDNRGRVLRYDEALAKVQVHRKRLVLVMQHGDLTPWQIFKAENEWIIYDGERSGVDLFRYNDLAYGYGRLYTKLHSPETAAALLAEFIERHGRPRAEFMYDFLPVLLGRAMGMLSDAYHDSDTNDYVELAEQLLAICVDGNTNLLF